MTTTPPGQMLGEVSPPIAGNWNRPWQSEMTDKQIDRVIGDGQKNEKQLSRPPVICVSPDSSTSSIDRKVAKQPATHVRVMTSTPISKEECSRRQTVTPPSQITTHPATQPKKPTSCVTSLRPKFDFHKLAQSATSETPKQPEREESTSLTIEEQGKPHRIPEQMTSFSKTPQPQTVVNPMLSPQFAMTSPPLTMTSPELRLSPPSMTSSPLQYPTAEYMNNMLMWSAYLQSQQHAYQHHVTRVKARGRR